MSTWMDKATALTFVSNEANFDNSALGTGTNYDAALFDNGPGTDKGLVHAFDTQPNTPTDTRLVYFLSDGDPTAGGATGNPAGVTGTGISATEETTWINFLNANNVQKVTAVGFGDVANPNNLEPIAWAPGETQSTFTVAGREVAKITTSSLSATAIYHQLGEILVGTVPTTTSGNVVTVDSGSGVDSFGADGGRIQSITINGTTYTWDGATKIDPGTPGNPGDDLTATTLTDIPTAQGGKLSFNFTSGAWTYTTPATVAAAVDETFTYTVVDNDGDKTGTTLTVHLVPVGGLPQIFTALDHPFWTSDTAAPRATTKTSSIEWRFSTPICQGPCRLRSPRPTQAIASAKLAALRV